MKRVYLRINELLEKHSVSKNVICRDLELARGNFNRYCRGDFQRIDTKMILKLCEYFKCDINDLIVIVDDDES